MVRRCLVSHAELYLQRLRCRGQVSQAAAPLWILDLTGAAVGVHEGGDAVRGRGPARLYQLQPQVTLADPEAVAHGTVARGLLLEDRHNDLLALEGLFDPEIHHGTLRSRAEAVLGSREPHERFGAQHRLHRDPVDEPAGLAAFRALRRRGRSGGLDRAAAFPLQSDRPLSASTWSPCWAKAPAQAPPQR